MQHNSFFLGCNYSNSHITDATTGWSLCPVQDIDTVLTNRYGVNVNVNVDDTFSLLYRDLYVRQLKEELKHTMLVHESVFESQIHELHRLYQRQKELMMEMEVTRHNEALYLNSGFPGPRTHWMSSSVSAYHTGSFPYEEDIPNQIEAVANVAKSEKVLDLELPVFEYNGEERGFMNGEVDGVPNFLKEQSLRRMSLECGRQSNKPQLDLNEPAKIEEHSDYGFNQFLSSVTSNEIGEESDTKNEGEDSVKDSYGMDEAEGQPLSAKCQGEYGIDLNVSLLSTEGVTIVKKFVTEKPQESLSVSLHEKHGSKQSRMIVQALPCSNSILLLAKQYKPLMRGSMPGKKVKLGPSNKTLKGSDRDPHSSAQATSESQSNQMSMEKGSSSSLSKVISTRNRTNLEKKRTCEQQMNFSNCQNVVTKKRARTKRKKSRRIYLVTEGNYQEISAAKAIVDMSREPGRETSDFITSLSKNLLWLAEISSSVVEDYEIEDFDAMTLHLPLEEHKKSFRLNSADNKTAASSIVHVRQRRSRARQGKRKCKDDQHVDNSSFGTFPECEANEDLQVLEKVTEASESKWACMFPENTPPKPRDAFISSVEEKTGVDWGVIKKQRRSSRIPASDFQQMIIN
ncbi:unnamed protein product [Arabis nemorensis]|uniref:Uncharacterized protein n=1 Tax=Arabis nemorensis TaxID=586526 RepID=A0A565CJ07_9BRAS|nr:unnamed protein product [Arabis nemorensis]